MTTTEAAQRLGLSPKTIQTQIQRGVIKARKVGRDWVIDPAEVERYRLWNKEKAEQ